MMFFDGVGLPRWCLFRVIPLKTGSSIRQREGVYWSQEQAVAMMNRYQKAQLEEQSNNYTGPEHLLLLRRAEYLIQEYRP